MLCFLLTPNVVPSHHLDKSHTMLEQEKIRQHYNLTDEFATTWTEPKAFAELDYGKAGKSSKYALLRQLVSSASTSSNVPLPQDEPDPLGSTQSIISVLKSRKIDVKDASKRSKYFVSSTKFNPRVFLRDVHPEATYENLLNSLDFLELTINQRSEALRFLVEHDYDRFVRSKSSLDSVFNNVQSAGFNESEQWGVVHLQGLIDEANSKAALIMKPVLENKSKHSKLKTALVLIEKNKYLFNLPTAMLHHIKIHDHDSLIRDFRRGRDIRDSEDDVLVDPSSKDLIDNKKVTDRIWSEVKNIVEDYKKEQWIKLGKVTADQNYLGVISKLLELGCEDNPIHVWISSQIESFQGEVVSAFDKLKSTMQMHRVNILAVRHSPSGPLISALRDFDKAHTEQNDVLWDSYSVIEMWLTIKNITQDIARIMTRFCQFWQCCQGFLDGTLQKSLPRGWHNESVPHLSFSEVEVSEIQKQGRDIVSLVAEETSQFFSLMSPSPTLPQQSAAANAQLQVNKPSSRRRTVSSPEVEVPNFLPPHSNALSAVKYLSCIIFQLAVGFNDFARLNISSRTTRTLQEVLDVIRAKAVAGILHAWAQDSSYLYLIENWSLSPTDRHLTKVPNYLRLYEKTVILGMKDILRIEYNGQTLEDSDIIPPVTNALLTSVLSSFAGSISAALDGVMKLALPMETGNHRRSVSATSLVSPSSSQSTAAVIAAETSELLSDALSEDKKVLLTIANLTEIRDVVMPNLFRICEQSFRFSSRESALTLSNSINTMDSTLFEIYTRRKKTLLADGLRTNILKAGINWAANDPFPASVSSYLYDCLLRLVVIHSNVTDVVPNQVRRVTLTLYEHIVKTLLSCFREIEQFGRYGLYQAVTDIGFIRIMLENYQTEKVANTYSLMYDTVKESSVDKSVWDPKSPPWQLVNPVIMDAQASSKMDFRCFSV